MQEHAYFRLPETQRIMLDVLFIYCRLNPDVSYRQGMHEILAPILWVVESDAIDLGESSKAMGEDALIKDVFDGTYIEHDAFALFGQTMQSAKNFYEQTTHQGAENPIGSRSRKIFTDMLPLVDPELAQHLESVDIVPQVFLIRWIRLIFGREYNFEDLLTIWDVIFAEDQTLEIVDHICLTMLLRMRWQLIEADYNSALTLLLKYPIEDENKDFQPQSLALDALYLREHMDYHGGSYLVMKYTGKPLLHNERPATPPALQRNITTITGPNAWKASKGASSLSPSRPARPPRAFESVLRSTAKNIYARSEELGIGKAVKGAVDEVHRRAQEIRDLQTPSPPASVRYRGPRGSSGSAASFARVRALEERSKQLAKLLEGAVTELWEYQKDAAERTDTPRDPEKAPSYSSSLEKLSIAIAKVQFVQVYLDDPALPLPEEQPASEAPVDDTSTSVSAHERQAAAQEASPPPRPSETPFDDDLQSEKLDRREESDTVAQAVTSPAQDLADPSTFEELSGEAGPDLNPGVPEIAVPEGKAEARGVLPQQETSRPESPRSRPSLEQSSFSWMLGQQDEPKSQPARNAFPFPADQARNRSFLFGDEGKDSRAGSRDRRGSSKDGKGQEEEEAFDLGSLRHGKKK